MEDSDTLVKQFEIEIPVYIEDSDKRRKENLNDSELCNEIIRLHFLEKIKGVNVYVYFKNGERLCRYYYERTDGVTRLYKPQKVTEESIYKIMFDKRGGCRNGAGRPAYAGMGSVPVRVPRHLKTEFTAFIDMYAQFTSKNKVKLEAVGRTSEYERKDALVLLGWLYNKEHERIENLKEHKRREEENKRQLKLFPEEP